MAEGWLRLLGGEKIEVHSAGIEAHGLNPRAVEVMKEAGVDISLHSSKTIDAVQGMEFDFVITVCDNAREQCPYFPAKSVMLHHDFPDPARATGNEKEVMLAFRSVRDQIRRYCQAFVIEHLG